MLRVMLAQDWELTQLGLVHFLCVFVGLLLYSFVCMCYRYTGAPYFAAISAMKVVSTLLLLFL